MTTIRRTLTLTLERDTTDDEELRPHVIDCLHNYIALIKSGSAGLKAEEHFDSGGMKMIVIHQSRVLE